MAHEHEWTMLTCHVFLAQKTQQNYKFPYSWINKSVALNLIEYSVLYHKSRNYGQNILYMY